MTYTCPISVDLIYDDENIGDSLVKINNNFNRLKNAACDLEKQIDDEVNIRTFFYYGPNAATNPESGMNANSLSIPSTDVIQTFVNSTSGLDLLPVSEKGDVVYVVYQKTGWYYGSNNYVRSGGGQIPYQVTEYREEIRSRDEVYFETRNIPAEDYDENTNYAITNLYYKMPNGSIVSKPVIGVSPSPPPPDYIVGPSTDGGIEENLGGYDSVDIADSGVIEAANFAATEISSETGITLSVTEVVAALRSVVAGYKYLLELLLSDPSSQPYNLNVQVYKKPDGSLELLAWEDLAEGS